MLNRRQLLQGTAVLALAGLIPSWAFADDAVPIVFVHGDSDAAAFEIL